MPLSRKSPMKRTRMKAERPKRTEEEIRTRILVMTRSQGWCELRLPGCAGRNYDMAHRIGRGVGGPWTPANVMASCRVCHSWCHANPAAAKDLGLMLESWQKPESEPVAYCNSGWVRLDADGGLWPVGDEAA